MSVEQIVNALTIVFLVALMIRIGLSVSLSDVLAVTAETRLLVQALIVNFLVAPLIAFALIKLFQPLPFVAAGLLILVAFPGAPFGPAFTAAAKGDIAFAVGLMIFLMTLSVPLSPLLLGYLLSGLDDSGPMSIHHGKIIMTLVVLQMAPLWIGLAAGELRPSLKGKPANALRILANMTLAVLCVVIVWSDWRALLEFCQKRLRAWQCFLQRPFVSVTVWEAAIPNEKWPWRL